MKYIILILIPIFFFNCKKKDIEQPNLNDNKVTQIDTLHEFKINKNDSGDDQAYEEINENDFGNDQSYEEMQSEYIKRYSEKNVIDTCFYGLNNKIINLKFEYYCLFDTLTIPTKYDWGNSPHNFKTHNFASHVVLSVDSKKIVSRTITKEDFKKVLDESLIKYGVLLYPNIRGFDKETGLISIQYSLSIPLTDVGTSVKLDIALDGKLFFGSDTPI